MSTHLFLTHEEDSAQEVQEEDWSWSCSSKVRKGDRILVYFSGVRKELVYEWIAMSDPYPGENYPTCCHVRFVRSFDPPISLDLSAVGAAGKGCLPADRDYLFAFGLVYANASSA